MKTSVFTTTSKGLPVIGYEFGNANKNVLILGGVHGDEVEGVLAARGLLSHFMNSFPYTFNLMLVPEFNLEGVIFKTRGNGNGVDLNRNLPTKDWSPEIKTPRYHPGPSPGSEPENKGLIDYIDLKKPDLIISLHSWHPVLNVNGDCLEVAKVLAQHTGYKIDTDIGYPTPGCLGTYAGLERQCPTITYEIERGLIAEEILRIHVPAILEPHLVIEPVEPGALEALEVHPAVLRLREKPENKVYAFESQDVILRTQDGQFRGGIARGVTSESLNHFINELQKMNLRENGKANAEAISFSVNDVPGPGEIILGTDLAQSLGVYEGDFVTVFSPAGLLLPPGEMPKFERVQVKRIVTTTLADIDSQVVFYQRGKALTSLSGEGLRKIGVEAWLGNERSIDSVQEELLKFSGIRVESWKDRNAALFYALKLEKLTIGIFLGLAGLIAASSIITVLSLLLSQKRRDIAILRTMGLSSKQTVRVFAIIGFLLSSSGVLVGTALGTGIGYYIQFHPLNFLSKDLYYDASIPALVDFYLVFWVLFIGAAVAWFGSYIPARTAAQVNASEALRMK